MENADLFPNHPCPLARPDNRARCINVRLSAPARCARCKTNMADHLWDALHNGDRSLVLMLMPPKLHDKGFFPEAHEGPCHAPVFELARDDPSRGPQGACFIVPEEDGGRFEILLVTGDDTDRHARRLTLDEAVALAEDEEFEG